MKTEIYIPKILIKVILWFTQFFNDNKLVLVCKGYGDDWDYYTGLYWNEDKNADFNGYEDFQLWVG